MENVHIARTQQAQLVDVKRFGKMNGLTINVYGEDREKNKKKGDIFPFYISKEKKIYL